MDPKALAKAKRRYSQQGRRKHPTPVAAAQKKKAAHAESEEKSQQAHSHALASNWDRYDDGDEEAEITSGTTMEEVEIAPKSKGANFSYLIEQARSQHHELRAPSVPESPSFFYELSKDFMKGASSIRTVRRKNIISRCEDDNFVVEDELTSSYEVPFLNLDLHALAAQLSNIELSKRLCIEEDLLPKDLRFEELEGSSSLQPGLGAISPANSLLGYAEDHSSTVFQNSNISHIENSLDNVSKNSALEVGKAEEELDMLLKSFQETSLSGLIQGDLDNRPASKISSDKSLPFHLKSGGQSPAFFEGATLFSSIQGSPFDYGSKSRAPNFDLFNPTQGQSSDQGQVSSEKATSTSIDDSIDELLAETSLILKMQKHSRIPDPPPPSMLSATNHNYLHLGLSSNDYLRADTSVCIGGKKSRVTQNGAASSEDQSSSLGSQVQMDDFDSWIDSL